MPYDILLDENFNPVLSNGDFTIGESTYQHQKMLLYADKGQFKADPLVGVGSRRFLETSKQNDFAREIRQQFYADGMTVNKIEIKENFEINIDAQY
ncbi:hypothetical protein NZ698_00550 [Chryseobacterium sp. PBS4-4]|uniref:Oxidase n=1 Tax=Chryseobacterium edaphi TaxID=2976532 RepID=A0ABT2W097_9FLAO|nr:hypothetical protein [Chryseobacterium edaphi]MCU7615670.1 hypothetical protein [Chryseobacterium edaphi]